MTKEEPKAKWFRMENLKSILIEKAFELIILAVAFAIGIYVQNKIFESQLREITVKVETLTNEINRTAIMFNQHLVWSEGKAVSLDELRRRVEVLESKTDQMMQMYYRQRNGHSTN